MSVENLFSVSLEYEQEQFGEIIECVRVVGVVTCVGDCLVVVGVVGVWTLVVSVGEW